MIKGRVKALVFEFDVGGSIFDRENGNANGRAENYRHLAQLLCD